jgi:hypothetical protein
MLQHARNYTRHAYHTGTAFLFFRCIIKIAFIMKKLETTNIRSTEKQLWLESVVNNLGKALLTTDTHGNITFLNEPAQDLLNNHDESEIGRPLGDVIKIYSTASFNPVVMPLKKAIEAHRVFQSEQSMFMVDGHGKRRYVTFSISPIKPNPKVSGGTVCVLCTYETPPNIDLNKVSAKAFEMDPEQNSIRSAAFYTKREGQFVRVMVDEVLWVEAMENYVQLNTEEDRFLVHTTMKKIAERLESQGFVRVHRSYIVPINRVDAIEENKLRIGEKEIPIGKSYKQDLLQALTFI